MFAPFYRAPMATVNRGAFHDGKSAKETIVG